MGFSPFGIESEAGDKDPLGESYGVLAELAPLLAEHQSKGDVHGFVLNSDRREVDFTMSGYTVHVSLDEIFGNTTQNGFGLIMATGPEEFLGAGKGFRVTFTPRSDAGPQVGIGAVDEERLRMGSGFRGGG